VGVADKHYRFEIFRAGLLPDIEIVDATASVLSSTDNPEEAASADGASAARSDGAGQGRFKIVEVSVVVENQGALATHTAEGVEIPGNREDVVWLVGDRDRVRFLEGSPVQELGVLAGALPIPGFEDESQVEGMPANRREVRWLLAVEGDSPLKVVVSSQKGGTKVKELRIG
jgi:hypothetical protein